MTKVDIICPHCGGRARQPVYAENHNEQKATCHVCGQIFFWSITNGRLHTSKA